VISFYYEVLKYIIHYSLECSETISYTKEYYQRFENSVVHVRDSLLLIYRLYMDIVKTPVSELKMIVFIFFFISFLPILFYCKNLTFSFFRHQSFQKLDHWIINSPEFYSFFIFYVYSLLYAPWFLQSTYRDYFSFLDKGVRSTV